jgi:hypothetical protein
MIDAVIAIGILLLALAGMFAALPAGGTSSEKFRAYEAIAEVGDSGELRQLIAAGNTSGIADRLKPWIGDFELEICDSSCIGPSRRGAIALEWFHSGMFSADPKRLRVYVFG